MPYTAPIIPGTAPSSGLPSFSLLPVLPSTTQRRYQRHTNSCWVQAILLEVYPFLNISHPVSILGLVTYHAVVIVAAVIAAKGTEPP
jgi:hypothetical protein